MYRIVRRPPVSPSTRVHEVVTTTLGIAGLAGVMVAAGLSTLALSPLGLLP
jgi:hypothetical protein